MTTDRKTSKIKRIPWLLVALILLSVLAYWFWQSLQDPDFESDSSFIWSDPAPSTPQKIRFTMLEWDVHPDESLQNWIKRQNHQNTGNLNFYMRYILQCEPNQAFDILNHPASDSLAREVAAYWSSDKHEILEAKIKVSEVLQRYRQWTHTPMKPMPVLGMLGLFQYQCALTDSSLWLGLDLFMKEDYRYYHTVHGLYQYQIRRTHPRHLPPAVARSLAQDLMDSRSRSADADSVFATSGLQSSVVLGQCLYEGKIMFLVNTMLLESHDSLLLGYTPAQWKWIEKNQEWVWRKWISEEILFSEDPLVMARCFSDGPYSSNLDAASPPALGKYFGYKIIKQWIARNGKSKDQIMRFLFQTGGDPASILRESGYRGREEG